MADAHLVVLRRLVDNALTQTGDAYRTVHADDPEDPRLAAIVRSGTLLRAWQDALKTPPLEEETLPPLEDIQDAVRRWASPESDAYMAVQDLGQFQQAFASGAPRS